MIFFYFIVNKLVTTNLFHLSLKLIVYPSILFSDWFKIAFLSLSASLFFLTNWSLTHRFLSLVSFFLLQNSSNSYFSLSDVFLQIITILNNSPLPFGGAFLWTARSWAWTFFFFFLLLYSFLPENLFLFPWSFLIPRPNMTFTLQRWCFFYLPRHLPWPSPNPPTLYVTPHHQPLPYLGLGLQLWLRGSWTILPFWFHFHTIRPHFDGRHLQYIITSNV